MSDPSLSGLSPDAPAAPPSPGPSAGTSAPPVPGATPGRPRAFVHIGLPKTGTSYLQTLMWGNPDALSEMGVRMVPATAGAAFALKKALRKLEEDGTGTAKELRQFQRAVQRADEPSVVISQELLGSASEGQSARLLECFGDREAHLVITLRDLARRLPSTWQQRVKGHIDIDYATFLDDILAERGVGQDFARHQDAVGVLRRWTVHFPPERVHVVTIPGSSTDRSLLPTRFGEAVGIDFDRLDPVSARANESMDHTQTELVRRINRLTKFPSTKQSLWARRYLSGQVMAPRRGGSLRAPEHLEPWCREKAEEQIAYIKEQGFTVHGDLEELRPTESSFGPMPPEPSAEELLEAAVPAMADLLMRASEDADKVRKLQKELRSLSSPTARAEHVARNAARKVKRRLERRG